MKTYRASLTHKGATYTAALVIEPETGLCLESVVKHCDMGGREIHSASFPESNLGTASRDEYARVMLASIAEAHARLKTA